MTTREKILFTSQQLFFEQGYNKTSVQNIIDGVGIAKGTFYHYFKSKHELLEELTDLLVEDEVKRVRDYINNTDDDPITMLNTIHHDHVSWKMDKLEMLFVVFQAMYADANSPFRLMMEKKSFQQNLPLYNTIIQRGVQEGYFDTEYPDLVGELVLNIGLDLSNKIAHIILHHKDYKDPYETASRHIEFMFHAMERMLGAYEGTIEPIETEFLKKIFDYMIAKEATQ